MSDEDFQKQLTEFEVTVSAADLSAAINILFGDIGDFAFHQLQIKHDTELAHPVNRLLTAYREANQEHLFEMAESVADGLTQRPNNEVTK